MKLNAALAFFAIVIAAISLTVMTVDIIAEHQDVTTLGDAPRQIDYVQGVTKSNGYYNIAIAIPNTSANKTCCYDMVGNLDINQVAQEDIPGLTMYINGTWVNASNPIRYNLESGDTAQINMLVPCTAYPSGSTVNIIWWGSSQMWGERVQLP